MIFVWTFFTKVRVPDGTEEGDTDGVPQGLVNGEDDGMDGGLEDGCTTISSRVHLLTLQIRAPLISGATPKQ